MEEMMRMLELSAQGFHCSQVLVTMGLEAQGKSNPDLVRVMDSLGTGVGGTGKICGALTGGACLLGLYAGRGRPEEDADTRLDEMIGELVRWFEEKYGGNYGGIDCNDILQGDRANAKARCPGIVSETYGKVKELLLENGFDMSSGREA